MSLGSFTGLEPKRRSRFNSRILRFGAKSLGTSGQTTISASVGAVL